MLITFGRACEELQVKPSTLYQWCAMGLVPVIRVGRCLRFDKDQLISWFKEGEFQRAKAELLRNKKGDPHGY